MLRCEVSVPPLSVDRAPDRGHPNYYIPFFCLSVLCCVMNNFYLFPLPITVIRGKCLRHTLPVKMCYIQL